MKRVLSPPKDNDMLGNFIIRARPAAEKGEALSEPQGSVLDNGVDSTSNLVGDGRYRGGGRHLEPYNTGRDCS